jgi:hypothetical protein
MTAGGGFELQTLDTTIVNPWLKTVGDVDGDGRTDIVVGGAIRGGLVVYLNRFPAWERQVVDAKPKFSTDGEVADLDGDGRNDIVAITIGPDTLTWYRNTGSGWTPQVLSDKTLHDVEVADFDGDGRPDIVARNQKEWPAGGRRGPAPALLLAEARGGESIVGIIHARLPARRRLARHRPRWRR